MKWKMYPLIYLLWSVKSDLSMMARRLHLDHGPLTVMVTRQAPKMFVNSHKTRQMSR
jgi:hypothetical protein